MIRSVFRQARNTGLVLFLAFFCAVSVFPQESPPSAQESSTNKSVDVETDSPDTVKYSDESPDQEVVIQREVPGDMLILEVFLKDIYLDEAFLAYQKGKTIFLPIGYLFSKLQFPITVDVDTGTATGWFIETTREFNLNVPTASLAINQIEMPYDAKGVIWSFDDILVDTALLEQWLPLKIRYSALNQALSLTTTELIPLEEKIEREKRQAKLQNDKEGTGIDKTAITNSEYSLFSTPNTNVRGTLNVSGASGTSLSLSTISKGDLLNTTMNLSTSLDSTYGLRTLRLSLGRKDQDIRLNGQRVITEYEVGDIFNNANDLINSSNYGVGFRLGNFPLSENSNPGTTPINGILEPSWEVELYKDGLLVDFTNTNAVDGSYEFPNAPLRLGLNIFNLKFYGPSGEKRERTIRYYHSSDISAKNQLYYRFAVNKHSENLYTSEETVQSLASNPAVGRFHTNLDLEYGLLDNLTADLSLISSPSETSGEINNYTQLGAKLSFEGIYGTVKHAIHTQSGGSATQLSAMTNYNRYSLLGKIKRFSGEYDSDKRPYSSDAIMSSIEARVSSYIDVLDNKKLIYSVSDVMESHSQSGGSNDLSVYMTLPYGRSSYSNRLNLSSGGTQTNTFVGVFSSSQYLNPNLSLRGEVGYDLSPNIQLDQLSAKASYKIDDISSFYGNVAFYFSKLYASGSTRDASSQFSVQYNHKFPQFSMGVLLSAQSSDNKVSVNFTSNFGQTNIQGDWIFTPVTLTEKGYVIIRTFFDENDNGTYDPEEDVPVENARFKLNRKHIEGVTDHNGMLTIPGINAYSLNEFELDESSLETIYWNAEKKIQYVNLHPGASVFLDFIIQRTGEIEGTVFEIKKDSRVGIGGVELELYDLDGNLVKQAKTLYDGFYLFDRIPTGQYNIFFSKDQLKQYSFEVVNGNPGNVEILEDDIKVIDLEIQKEMVSTN